MPLQVLILLNFKRGFNHDRLFWALGVGRWALGVGWSIILLSHVSYASPLGSEFTLLDTGRHLQSASSLSQGLVAYYPFNGNAQDESGYHHDGTVTNAVLTQDRFGSLDSAYSFNGVDSKIVIATDQALEIGYSDFTIAAWVKPAVGGVNGNNGRIFSKGSSGCVTGYMLRMAPDGATHLENAKDGSCMIYCQNNIILTPNYWHFVVGAVNRSSGGSTYINGTLDRTCSNPTNGIDLSNNRNPMIGFNDVGNYYEPFNGVIDEVRVYNRVLSNDEIQSLYQQSADCSISGYQCVNPNTYCPSGKNCINAGADYCAASGNQCLNPSTYCPSGKNCISTGADSCAASGNQCVNPNTYSPPGTVLCAATSSDTLTCGSQKYITLDQAEKCKNDSSPVCLTTHQFVNLHIFIALSFCHPRALSCHPRGGGDPGDLDTGLCVPN